LAGVGDSLPFVVFVWFVDNLIELSAPPALQAGFRFAVESGK
jgi:hypothetical protein